MKRIIAKILIVVVAFATVMVPADVSEAYTGYVKVGKYYYFYDSDGVMQKYSQIINGKPYYFKSSGKAADKGWLVFSDGTKKYCQGNGKLATGYKKVGKYYYYFDDIGTGYKNNILSTDSYSEYIFIYNIKNEDKDSDFILKYLGNEKKIKLSPEVLD